MNKKVALILKGMAMRKTAIWNGKYWEGRVGGSVEIFNRQLKKQGYKIIKEKK